ncbi:MAG: ACT domain-containing protein [Boseongicola sp. SB0676_bin_33]|nr:ACT domain-containing protein [Boseongicola sp. SB0676_bin_33]
MARTNVTDPIKDTRRVIAEMQPLLHPGAYVFCSGIADGLAADVAKVAKGSFVEDEGLSFIIPQEEADRIGIAGAIPMRQITLMVLSALDGVGLTAAVSSALAAKGIPANVVAAARHDHVFVPADRAEEALAILRARQAEARDGP